MPLVITKHIQSLKVARPFFRACLALLAVWVSTCCYVGRISLFRPFCIAVCTLLLGGGLCLAMGMQPPIDYARALIKLAVVLFVLGWAAVALHRRKSDGVDVVIDQVVGQLILLALAFPGVIYAYFAVHTVLSHVCQMYIFCQWYMYYVGYIIGLAIPLVLFNAFIYCRPWPMSLLDQEFRNSLGTMLNDIVAAFYSLIVFYFLGFVFMRANMEASYEFIVNAFR